MQQKLAQKNPQLACFTKYLVELLAEWVDTFPYDFRDDRLMSELKAVIQICSQINQSIRVEVSQLQQNLLLKLKSLENYEVHISKLNCVSAEGISATPIGLQQQFSTHTSHSPKSNSSSNSSTVVSLLAQTSIFELVPSSLVLAQQLTHIELERLSHIGYDKNYTVNFPNLLYFYFRPEEFVQAFAKEQPSLEASPKKTTNLESYVAWFNRLSFLVCTDVIKVSKILRVWGKNWILFFSTPRRNNVQK